MILRLSVHFFKIITDWCTLSVLYIVLYKLESFISIEK